MKKLLIALDNMQLFKFHRFIAISILIYSYMLLVDSHFIFRDTLIPSLNLINLEEATVRIILYINILLSLTLFFRESNLSYILLGFGILTLIASNSIISGIDTSLYIYALFLIGFSSKKSKKSNALFLTFSLGCIYFLSGISKILTFEWRNGSYIELLADSGLCYELSSHFIKYFNETSRVSTITVMALELTAPITLGIKKTYKKTNQLFIFFHFLILLTIKIPHLSMLMIALHIYLINDSSIYLKAQQDGLE